jgi:hypothetical protein
MVETKNESQYRLLTSIDMSKLITPQIIWLSETSSLSKRDIFDLWLEVDEAGNETIRVAFRYKSLDDYKNLQNTWGIKEESYLGDSFSPISSAQVTREDLKKIVANPLIDAVKNIGRFEPC